jgi:hypothetical protein
MKNYSITLNMDYHRFTDNKSLSQWDIININDKYCNINGKKYFVINEKPESTFALRKYNLFIYIYYRIKYFIHGKRKTEILSRQSNP